MTADAEDRTSRKGPGTNIQRIGRASDDQADAPPPDSWSPATKDFLIFEGKLFLDGFLDLIMAPMAALAFLLDLFAGDRTGRRFYRTLRRGRRLEHWLRLYRPASRVGAPKDNLTDAGLAGADQLVAKIEDMLREKELPEAYRARLRVIAEKARAYGRDRDGEPGDD